MPDSADGRSIVPFPDVDGQAALRRARFMATKPPGVVCHAMALRLSKLCFELVSDCVPESLQADVELAFHALIKSGLQEFWDGRMQP